MRRGCLTFRGLQLNRAMGTSGLGLLPLPLLAGLLFSHPLALFIFFLVLLSALLFLVVLAAH